MTVKTISQAEKNYIVSVYPLKTHTLLQLAKMFNTSSRTIGRVLEEAGLHTPVPRLKKEAYLVMKLLEEHKLDVAGLHALFAQKNLTADPFITKVNPMVELLESQGIADVTALTRMMDLFVAMSNKPALNHDNVQAYLNQCSREQRANYFYTSELTRIAEIAKQAADENKQTDATTSAV